MLLWVLADVGVFTRLSGDAGNDGGFPALGSLIIPLRATTLELYR